MTQKIAEEKKCKVCAELFSIFQDEIDFIDKISPKINGQVYQLPKPSQCPDCRQRHRLSFFNERNLYKRKSDFSEEMMVSMYSPDKDIKVYTQKEWWGEAFEGVSFGRTYKLWIDFFAQFQALNKEVPKIALLTVNCENCEFNNYLDNSKNCYLCISNQELEDCHYINASQNIKSSLDCWWSGWIENSYEMFNCARTSHSFFCLGCADSSNLYFCEECISCHNCMFSYGLYNKRYHIFNKEYSKEEYEKKIKELSLFSTQSIEQYKTLFASFISKIPHKFSHEERNENCTWDYMYGNKDCTNCFSVVGIENGYWIFEGGRVKNVYDSTNIYDGEGYTIGSVLVNHWTKVYFSYDIYTSSDIFYSTHLYNCKFCFWCTGLKNKEYCILNKQYSKEEYFEKVKEIISSMQQDCIWGEFFPSSISSFGYNDTVAQEYFPITKKDAEKLSFSWSDYEAPLPKVEKVIPASRLPESITQVPDDILNWAIQPENTSFKPFRVTKEELVFYRLHNLPIPRKNPLERHLDRMKQRNQRKLSHRKCSSCNKDIITTYSIETSFPIYCSDCYKKTVL